MKNEIKNLIEMYKIKGKRNVAAYLVVEDFENLLKLYEEAVRDAHQEGWNKFRDSIEKTLASTPHFLESKIYE